MKRRPGSNLAGLLDGAPLEPERISCDPSSYPGKNGGYVLLWMQKAQRSRDNPALNLGFHCANRLKLPLVVLFVLTDYPGAKPPHYRFMLEGIEECAVDLRARGVIFILDEGEMVAAVARQGRGAALVIADEGKLAFEREWRMSLGRTRGLPPLILVETESVVPPSAASDHLEWSAATLRKKISSKLPFFLNPPSDLFECSIAGRQTDYPSRDELFPYKEKRGTLPNLQRISFRGGRAEGMERFRNFVESSGLERYGEARNDPAAHGQSEMSPYLHFGQVSPVALARSALERSVQAAQPYIEQLVVRRELALNFVLHCPGYDKYDTAVPDWAKKSLGERSGMRTLYGKSELERGETEDRYWNAAQREMLLTGKMHNYMRMYWGKQLLSWCADPKDAFDTMVRLNDTYSLDGRDPNGYAGIAWCFGRHDRPWPMRDLFGSIRSMTGSGLRRKFDIERYASEVEALYTTREKETS
jgi:deoxyribodipyrimidine photo-lyase